MWCTVRFVLPGTSENTSANSANIWTNSDCCSDGRDDSASESVEEELITDSSDTVSCITTDGSDVTQVTKRGHAHSTP